MPCLVSDPTPDPIDAYLNPVALSRPLQHVNTGRQVPSTTKGNSGGGMLMQMGPCWSCLSYPLHCPLPLLPLDSETKFPRHGSGILWADVVSEALPHL